MKSRVEEMKEQELLQRQLRQLKKKNAELNAEKKTLHGAAFGTNQMDIPSAAADTGDTHEKGSDTLRARMRLQDLLFRR